MTSNLSESVIASLRKSFLKIDRNGDEKLTIEELRESIKDNFEKVGVELTDEKLNGMVDKAFIDMDKNKDGKITLNEFLASSWALVLF